MSLNISALLGKTYSIVNTSQTIANASSYTLSTFVGFGYRGGMANVRSDYSIPSGGRAGVEVVLRGTSSASETASSGEFNSYPRMFTRLVDTTLSNAIYSSGSTLANGVFLTNAWYEPGTGTVNFTFLNSGLGSTQTLNARINGIIY
jgi:hypothetical protein